MGDTKLHRWIATSAHLRDSFRLTNLEMTTDVNGVLRSIEVLVAAIPTQTAAEKIITYAAAVALCNDLRGNLDDDYIHHNYTRENIARLLDGIADLCGVSDFTFNTGGRVQGHSISSAIRMLDDPERWPSTCHVRNHLTGKIEEGTGDPD